MVGGKNMNQEGQPHIDIDYEEICEYLFERLTERGYVPESDELLDLGDIVMDLVIVIHVMMGGSYMLIEEEYDEEEE